jgi:alcohol dehydrogenase class IV
MSEMTKKMFACAYGAALAVMLAPVGAASADSTDTEFANYLQAHGINLGSASHAADLARTMCQDLENGNAQKDEVDELTNTHKLTQDQAEIFVGAATADYCPAKHPPSKPAAGG